MAAEQHKPETRKMEISCLKIEGKNACAKMAPHIIHCQISVRTPKISFNMCDLALLTIFIKP